MDSLQQYFLMSLISMAASLIVAFASIYFKDNLETRNITRSLKAELETNKTVIDKILRALDNYEKQGITTLDHIPYCDRFLITNYNALLYSGKFHKLSPEARLKIMEIYIEIENIRKEFGKSGKHRLSRVFDIDIPYRLLLRIKKDIEEALELL